MFGIILISSNGTKQGAMLLQHNECLIEEPFKEQTKPASHKNVLLNFQTLTFIVSVF